MYLDDGVSRDSAPANLPQYKYREQADIHDPNSVTDPNEAKSKYREVKIEQVGPSFPLPGKFTYY